MRCRMQVQGIAATSQDGRVPWKHSKFFLELSPNLTGAFGHAAVIIGPTSRLFRNWVQPITDNWPSVDFVADKSMGAFRQRRVKCKFSDHEAHGASLTLCGSHEIYIYPHY
jgi:hypothetical protein